MVYRSKDFTSLLSLGGLVKEYSNNCTNSCYLDRVGHSQDSKIERVHRDSLNKYPINLNSVFGIHRTEHIPCVKSVHRRIQTLADDIPWGAPVFFAWLMTYFFLIILTRTILSRKQLLSLWTWSVTHEFWFGLASPSSQLLLSFQMSSQPSFQRLAMLLGEQRELGRFSLKLRVIPRAGHCQCTDIFVHSSQIVSHYGPSLPSCNVIV